MARKASRKLPPKKKSPKRSLKKKPRKRALKEDSELSLDIEKVGLGKNQSIADLSPGSIGFDEEGNIIKCP